MEKVYFCGESKRLLNEAKDVVENEIGKANAKATIKGIKIIKK